MMNKDSLFKVYTGDYSQDGYDSGVSDAKQHKPQNKFRFIKAVNPINYVWKFNNAFDSFSQNYDHGYLDGQRVNNGIYQQNQTIGGGMMMADNYINHINKIENLKKVLIQLKGHLAEIEQHYQQQINAAEAAGFVQNYTDELKRRHQRFAAKIEALTQCLERQDVQLEQQQETIYRLKERAEQ
jgi:hypothetical protein